MELLSTVFNDCCVPSNCCTTGTSTSDCGAICIGDVGIADTLAQLKALPASVFPTTTAKKIFFMLGLDTIYDGGYRIYVADLANADTPDDYSVVEATNFGGRLKLLFG